MSIHSSAEIVQKQYVVSPLLLTCSESFGALTTSYGSATVFFETLTASELVKIINYTTRSTKTRVFVKV